MVYAEQQEGAGGSFGGSVGAAHGVGGSGIRPSGGSEAGACEDEDVTVGDAVGAGGTTRCKAGVSAADNVCGSSDGGTAVG